MSVAPPEWRVIEFDPAPLHPISLSKVATAAFANAGSLMWQSSSITSTPYTQLRRLWNSAVFAAYGWPVGLSDDELLAMLLALNLSRAGNAAVVAESDGDEE